MSLQTLHTIRIVSIVFYIIFCMVFTTITISNIDGSFGNSYYEDVGDKAFEFIKECQTVYTEENSILCVKDKIELLRSDILSSFFTIFCMPFLLSPFLLGVIYITTIKINKTS